MTALAVVQLLIYLGVILALAKPLGIYMARVYEGRPMLLGRALGPVERFLYRIAGVKADDEMDWKRYALAMLLFNFVGFLLLYTLQRSQGVLPADPAHFPGVAPDLSFNTAISFVTNTNWQSYSGEQTMSYLTQMFGLAVQNFLSAASGMAVLVALIRGFARRTTSTVGNFWVDTVRGTLYILLPLSLIFALALVSQGVVQTFSPYKKVALLQPVAVNEPKLDAAGAQVKDAQGNPVTETVTVTGQTLALGPAASQIAIKQLGTNGGGFFNVNSAHPFENPTPLSDFLETDRDPPAPGRPLLDVRGDGARPPPGVGDPRRDGRDLRRASRSSTSPASRAATRSWPSSAWTSTRPPRRPAATWRARRCASGRSPRRSGRPPRRRRRTAR